MEKRFDGSECLPYCQKCGAELKKDAKFCPKCGAAVGAEKRVQPTYVKEREACFSPLWLAK